MEELFKNELSTEIYFAGFANGLGNKLDRLKFEFEGLENGTIIEEDENADESKLVVPTQDEIDGKKVVNGKQTFKGEPEQPPREEEKRARSYTVTLQRAFSTVSLMNTFKTNFWSKHRKNKHGKPTPIQTEPENQDEKQRNASTSSEEKVEKNNNGMPEIKVYVVDCDEPGEQSIGRSSLYSTMPRKGKKIGRSKTMSPSTDRPKNALEVGPVPMQRTESGNIYIPPVIVDGQVVYDYQYSTPEYTAETSNVRSPKHKGKLGRRNSLSRLLRIRKSPKKSPKAHDTPLKALYQKTVLSHSVPNSIDSVGTNKKQTRQGQQEDSSPEKISNGNSPEKST